MTETEWDKLLNAWIAGQESEDRASDTAENWWAIKQEMEWNFIDDDESLWKFIIEVYPRKMSEKAFAMLAAGPVEDLLADFGSKYIDQVEELARRDPKFNHLLGGVWKNSMTDEVWARVKKARLKVW